MNPAHDRYTVSDGSLLKRCSCKNTDGKRFGGRCPKLRRGAGWNPHHGTWGYQLELPVLPGARRRQLRRTGFGDRDAAVAERDHARDLLGLAHGDLVIAAQIGDLLAECRPGTPMPDRDTIARRLAVGVPANSVVTVADYLTRWIERRRGLADNTIRSYRDHITHHLIPHLGHLPMNDLRGHHIETMFNTLRARADEIRAAKTSPDPKVRDTVKGVRPMGPASLQRLRATLRKALNDAIRRHKVIDYNHAADVELDSGDAPKARIWTDAAVIRWQHTGERPSPVMVWTPQQAGAFLDYVQAHDEEAYAALEFILHRGTRRGETCGLRDIDVDLDRHLAVISQQIVSVGYQPLTRKVKTRAGDRIIPLGAATITSLRAYLALRKQWQQAAGDDWPDTGLFFVRRDGNAWHPEAFSDRFETLLRRSGLPPVRLHDLRHCAATYLRHAGADMKEVQETLGHSRIGTTSDIYTSVILEFQRTTADAAAGIIPRKRRKAA